MLGGRYRLVIAALVMIVGLLALGRSGGAAGGVRGQDATPEERLAAVEARVAVLEEQLGIAPEPAPEDATLEALVLRMVARVAVLEERLAGVTGVPLDEGMSLEEQLAALEERVTALEEGSTGTPPVPEPSPSPTPAPTISPAPSPAPARSPAAVATRRAPDNTLIASRVVPGYAQFWRVWDGSPERMIRGEFTVCGTLTSMPTGNKMLDVRFYTLEHGTYREIKIITFKDTDERQPRCETVFLVDVARVGALTWFNSYWYLEVRTPCQTCR